MKHDPMESMRFRTEKSFTNQCVPRSGREVSLFQHSLLPIVLFGSSLFTFLQPLEAAYIYKNGKLYDEKYIAQESCEAHFEYALQALKEKEYSVAETELKTVIQSFPDSSYASDAPYYLGVIKFEQSDLDVANRYFTEYLNKKSVPEHYEDVYRYKLAIATRLANGERRHLFGYESLPKLMTGKQIAIDTFNEIIKALPYQELAAQAMLEKGDLLTTREEFPKAIECYQDVIRKFPKSTFAMNAFQAISHAYLHQLELEPQNTDALALAEINVREAKKMFSNAEEIQKLQAQIDIMKEGCANSLYDIGQLYERMGEPKAAVLCYATVVQSYPATDASFRSYERVQELQSYVQEMSLKLPSMPPKSVS